MQVGQFLDVSRPFLRGKSRLSAGLVVLSVIEIDRSGIFAGHLEPTLFDRFTQRATREVRFYGAFPGLVELQKIRVTKGHDEARDRVHRHHAGEKITEIAVENAHLFHTCTNNKARYEVRLSTEVKSI